MEKKHDELSTLDSLENGDYFDLMSSKDLRRRSSILRRLKEEGTKESMGKLKEEVQLHREIIELKNNE